MNVLIAPDSFKECLTAEEAAAAMARGVKAALPSARVRRVPLGDGGQGTSEILTRALGGRFLRARVKGPLGGTVAARWGWVPARKLALVEMAAASGLELVPPRRRGPLKTSTYGTGQLIRAALARGAREILVALGGSATVDGGLGMAQALGARFRGRRGTLLPAPAAGAQLLQIHRIDLSGLDGRLRRVRVRALCDVRSPLFGRRGAARVFGPQKGAAPAQVEMLDRGLRRLARVVRRDLGKDVAALPRAGAAGGLAAGLYAFLGARLESGIDEVLRAVAMDAHARWADVIFTGEGRADGQSLEGKTVYGLARLAKKHRKPLIVLAGSLGPEAGALRRYGVTDLRAVSPAGMPLKTALRRAPALIAAAAARAMRAAG